MSTTKTERAGSRLPRTDEREIEELAEREAIAVDAEVIPAQHALVRHLSGADLLAQHPDGAQIFSARVNLLRQARLAALKATKPGDWSLYKRRDGSVIGYLDAAGCARIKDFFGIEPEGSPTVEKVVDGDHFAYVFSGMVRSHFFQTRVWEEGGRSSDEEFFRTGNRTALELAMDVKKASLTNWLGRAVRQMAGLHSVDVDEIRGAGIDLSKVALARGFSESDKQAWANRQYDGVIGRVTHEKGVRPAEQQDGGGGYDKLRDERTITEPQQKRLFAVAKSAGVESGELKSWLLKHFGMDSSASIQRRHYDLIVACVEEGRAPTGEELARVGIDPALAGGKKGGGNGDAK